MKSDFKLLKAILSLDDSLKKTNKNAEKQEAEIKKHDSEIENISKDIKDNQAKINETKKNIQETAKELEKQETEIKKHNSEIENINKNIKNNQTEINETKKDIQETVVEVKKYNSKIENISKDIKDTQAEISETKKDVQKTAAEIKKHNLEIENINKDIKGNQVEINETKKDIQKTTKELEKKIENIKIKVPKDGKDGKDGISIIEIKIDKNGNLIITLSNNKEINCGRVRGNNGINGRNGTSIKNVEIKNNHLIITLTDNTEIDAGYIPGGSSGVTSYEDLTDKPTINNVELTEGLTLADLGIINYDDTEIKEDIEELQINKADRIEVPNQLSDLQDDTTHRLVTDTEKQTWNNKSDFSGDYNDLDNKPTIPVVPTNVSAFTNDAGYLTQHQDISGKYDKTGGEISGNVKIDGTLTLDIEDEDYDAGITFDKRLDDNLGTVLTLTGYANGDEPTSYKPIIRNIGTPNSSYDVANKKYVDDNVVVPTYHLVFLNADGTIDTYASTLTYNSVKANLTDPKEADYLDVVWNTTRFYAKCIEVTDVNNGDLKFIGEVEYQGIQRYIVFTLTPNNVLTTTNIITFESVSNKVSSIVSNSASVDKYPNTKAVFDEFQRKPVVVWETDTNFLNAIQADISANPAWQLTDLDMTPFKRIKIYSKAGKGRTTAGATGGMILEMSLDSRAGFADYGGNFVGSVLVQKPNDANRYASLTCAVSADKTKFVVLRQTSLYGTAATTNNDIGADVFKIEGYYD